MSPGRTMSAATVFNGYVGANVVFALHQIGLFDALRKTGSCSLAQVTDRSDVATAEFRTLVRTAELLGFLRVEGEVVHLTAAGGELARSQGYFTWAVGGYGDVFGELGNLALRRKTYGVDAGRNEAEVATGASEVDASFMASITDGVLTSFPCMRVADIGCGNGARLVQICRRDPARTGLGIDISKHACARAEETVAAAGLQDRITIVCADIRAVLGRRGSADLFAGVDLVSSFFMLHDLFSGDVDQVGVLHDLAAAFPEARHFLLADTVLQPWSPSPDEIPIFSLAFELAHSFMGVTLRSKSEYEGIFAAAGFTVAQCLPFGAPSSWLYLLSLSGILCKRASVNSCL